MYLEILRCGVDRWTSIWGDPVWSGGLIMALFGVASLLCGRTAGRTHGRARVFWIGASLCALVLVFNAHLDLHALPASLGRCAAKAQGWYDQRKSVQAIYLAVVAGSALLIISAAIWIFRRQLMANLLVTAGLVVTIGALAGKGSGFHQIDWLYQFRVGPLKVTDLPEIVGACLVILGAVFALKRLRRDGRRPFS